MSSKELLTIEIFYLKKMRDTVSNIAFRAVRTAHSMSHGRLAFNSFFNVSLLCSSFRWSGAINAVLRRAFPDSPF